MMDILFNLGTVLTASFHFTLINATATKEIIMRISGAGKYVRVSNHMCACTHTLFVGADIQQCMREGG